MFAQYGIELCRQTMSKWMIKSGNIFEILYDMMRRILLEQPVIFSDDTTVKVVGDNKAKSYMWLYGCGADSPAGKIVDSDIPNIVLFDYNSGRGGQVIVDYLDGYDGYMHADGYPGYHKTQATIVGFRVDEDITALTPHRPGRAQLTHPVLHNSLFAA
ncbi:hypothetical protein ALT1545_390007 [Alteromonas macleodii]